MFAGYPGVTRDRLKAPDKKHVALPFRRGPEGFFFLRSQSLFHFFYYILSFLLTLVGRAHLPFNILPIRSVSRC